MKWKICIDEPFENCSRIFPTQQKSVNKLITTFSRDSNVRRIIIFGSSVTSACNPWSDIDIYVELDEDRKLPKYDVEESVDLWTNFLVDERLFREIKEHGVEVYERTDAA